MEMAKSSRKMANVVIVRSSLILQNLSEIASVINALRDLRYWELMAGVKTVSNSHMLILRIETA